MKKFALCTFGVAAGAVVAAFTQGPVEEMLGYAENEPVAELATAEQPSEMKVEGNSAIRKTEPSKSSTENLANVSMVGNGESPLAAGDKAPSIKKSQTAAIANPVAKPSRQKVVAAKPPIEPLKKTSASSAKTKPIKSIDLSGDFSVVEAVHGGKKVASGRLENMGLEFENGRIAIRQGDKTEVGSIVAGGPFLIGDILATEIEIKSDRDGVPTIKGFYFQSGERIEMVWGKPGGDRPKSLEEKELGNARVLRLVPAEKAD